MTQPGTNGLQWIVIGTKEVFFPSGDEKERKVVKAGVEKESKSRGKGTGGKRQITSWIGGAQLVRQTGSCGANEARVEPTGQKLTKVDNWGPIEYVGLTEEIRG
jgi:hypothetical protein